jgi:glycosyltransferase involved in cell wall biosynthesis
MNHTNKIAFIMSQGHGHYTQFLNFQECFPSNQVQRAAWIPLTGNTSESLFNRFSFLPGGIRYRLNQLWHANNGLAQRAKWKAVIIAGVQLSLLKILYRYPCYSYTDLTPSLKRELSPWYDHQLGKNAAIRSTKEHIERYINGRCRGIITMSQWAAKGVMHDYKIDSDRVFVSIPGANLKRWHFIDRSHRNSETAVRILMVGGQFRLKGGELLLDWAKHTKLHNWELDIVTWPDELPEWIRKKLGYPEFGGRMSSSLAPQFPNVRVHCGMKANTEELMTLYREADIFCLPTQADGSSIASLEAMASGLPVLVSGVGGIPELIEDHNTGFLLRRSDAHDLSTKLEQLIVNRDLRLQIGKSARSACETFFNVTRQTEQLLAFLDQDNR